MSLRSSKLLRNIFHPLHRSESTGIKTKLSQLLAAIGNPDTWEKEYVAGRNPAWYCESKDITPSLKNIIENKSFLSSSKFNILLEIGCGTAPVLPRLIGHFKGNQHNIIGVCTDVSPKCMEEVKNRYSEKKKKHLRAFGGCKYSQRDDEFSTLHRLYPQMYCSILDVNDISAFIEDLRYFPLPNKSVFSSYPPFQRDESSFRTRIIVIDKGCLDVFVYAKHHHTVRSVIESCDALVSVTNEDPDTRIQYFQENFGRLPSIHFVDDDSNIFCYSLSNI